MENITLKANEIIELARKKGIYSLLKSEIPNREHFHFYNGLLPTDRILIFLFIETNCYIQIQDEESVMKNNKKRTFKRTPIGREVYRLLR
ncbi:hypothetical protein [Aureivirga sp. CE67]|uniref:hypothetical protein n=1 Tax=Aureivirga sp. CE67 TaxID=1788983 RepID=UPI0018CA059A|nr:hypothetical protein [Aureivirga sp. CE67]